VAPEAACLVRPIRDDEREELGRRVADRWGSSIVVSRERAQDVLDLPALVAVAAPGGDWLGTASYRIEADECELVQIEAFERGRGVGSALLEAVVAVARSARAKRLWLVTTNDNLDAIRFYQRRGWRLVRVWRDAVTRARRLKPEIPLVGERGIPITDEIELELPLD
jgi:GNAT superfamily N-acetyltransferase